MNTSTDQYNFRNTLPKTVFRAQNGRFFATINICNKNKFLGTFENRNDAEKAVQKALNGRQSKLVVCYY